MVLASLGMISVLLLTFTVSTGFVWNGYQKLYAAGDFPPSEFGTQIRGWVNNQIREELSPLTATSISVVKITLNGFPHQTSASVTNVRVTPNPCTFQSQRMDRGFCTGESSIAIPGIGQGSLSVVAHILVRGDIDGSVDFHGLPGQTGDAHFLYLIPLIDSGTLNIPGIGTGRWSVQVS